MWQNKKDLMIKLFLGSLFCLVWCLVLPIKPILAQEDIPVTGCCVYVDGDDAKGCIDGLTKEECGGETGIIGSYPVELKEQKFCKDVEICIADFKDPLVLAIPILGKTEINNLGEYIQLVYNWSIGAIAIIAVVMIMIAGFQWISSAGNEKAIGSAQQRIKNAIFGLVLIGGAYLILQIANPATLNIQLPNIIKIPPVQFENNIASSICDPAKYPDALCGLTTVIDKDKDINCMGAVCDKGLCELEFDSMGNIVSGNGCSKSIAGSELKWFTLRGGGLRIEIDTPGYAKNESITVKNNKECGLLDDSASGLTPGRNLAVGAKGDCFAIKQADYKYAVYDDGGRPVIFNFCQADDEACFQKIKNSQAFRSTDETRCDGQYNLSLTGSQMCGEYYYDSDTSECEFGVTCNRVSEICDVSKSDSMPVCAPFGLPMSEDESMSCGSYNSAFMRVGTRCDDGVCTYFGEGIYRCVAY